MWFLGKLRRIAHLWWLLEVEAMLRCATRWRKHRQFENDRICTERWTWCARDG